MKTTASMTTKEVPCRVLVIKPYGSDENVSLAEKSARVCLKDCPNTAIETRLLWARDIAKEFLACSKLYDNIRPREFILDLDGVYGLNKVGSVSIIGRNGASVAA